MKYLQLRSIQKNSPNTGFVLSTGLVNNPLISPQLWDHMLDSNTIGNFRVSVLMTPMKRIPCFHNYSETGTDAKYESAKMIMSVLVHESTSSFSTFVPLGRLSLSYSLTYSFLVDLTILSRIIIPAGLISEFWISSPLSGFLFIAA